MASVRSLLYVFSSSEADVLVDIFQLPMDLFLLLVVSISPNAAFLRDPRLFHISSHPYHAKKIAKA